MMMMRGIFRGRWRLRLWLSVTILLMANSLLFMPHWTSYWMQSTAEYWPATLYTNSNNNTSSSEGEDLKFFDKSSKNATNSVSLTGACLTDECFAHKASRLARAFPDRPKNTWCVPGKGELYTENSIVGNKISAKQRTKERKIWRGWLLLKTPKAASTTAAGVTLRIAHRHGCAVQYEHRPGTAYAHRTKKSILLGPVRRPAARALSAVYFFVTKDNATAAMDEQVVLERLKSTFGVTTWSGQGGFMTKYMSTDKLLPWSVTSKDNPGFVEHPDAAVQAVANIVKEYDFLMVSERMDESLTALALLTGLDVRDVLVTSSKTAGAYLRRHVGRDKGKCLLSSKPKESVAVKQFLKSDEFRALNYADYILYEAANQSLDLTIARLGKDRFAKALDEFQRLKQTVLSICGDRLGTGCTADGQVTNVTCYFQDFGCGYDCIDAVLQNETRLHSESTID